MTSAAPPRTLASLHRRIACRRLGRQTAVFAALLVAMVPVLVLHALERALPHLSVIVALPAAAGSAAAAESVETVLRTAAVRARLRPSTPADTEELWSALAGEGAAPHLVEATLWPAAAVDDGALRARLLDAAPGAVVDLRPVPAEAPGRAVAAAAALATLALIARWRLRRTVRQVLGAETATLQLLHRFGASRARIEAEVARPIRRRGGRGAVAGALLGAASGLAAVSLVAPELAGASSGVAAVPVASALVASALAAAGCRRVVAAATGQHLAAIARAAA